MFIIELLSFLVMNLFRPFENGNLTLYYPITIDRNGRMYNPGTFNIVNSTFFRQCLVSAKADVTRSCWPIIKDIRDIISVLSVSQKGTKEYIKYQYYQGLFRQANPRVFLDATGSMLQIYSLLFGDLKLAHFTNLGTDQYDPVVKISEH